jgi:3-oxoacyl-[acyl-carrier-protein] synthase-3
VLLTQSHLITRAVPLAHRASPNFGDLATALVVGRAEEPGLLALHARTHAEYADAMVWTREPPDETRPWWQAGGAFTLGTLDARGIQQVIAGTVKMARDVLLGLCRDAGVAPANVRALCSVQPRGGLPAAIAEAAGFQAGAGVSTFAELAHVGACGVVANLLEARRTGLLSRGDVVALYAQGAGLTCVAALVRWAA